MRTVDELELISSIADELAAGIWVATVPDGSFTYANRAFGEIMGMGGRGDVAAGEYSEGYGIYDRSGRLYPEDRLPFARALVERATVVIDDIVIHRRDGTKVYVRAQARPLYDAAGAMSHIAIVFFDITREVEAELARKQFEDRLRSMVASAPIVMFAMGVDGVLTMVEGRGLTALKIRPEDIIGRTSAEAFPQVPDIGVPTQRALAGESVATVVDFGEVSYEVHMAPLFGDQHEIVGAIGVAIDVTEQRRAQVRAAQAERLASIGLLAAGVAHEVNNPLTFTLGNLEQAEAALGAAEHGELRTMLRDARAGAERVREIVRGLKVFSRVEVRALEAVDLRAPLEAAFAMANNELRHRARLVREIGEAPQVFADQGRLAQLFLNLLVNAAHAIPEGAIDANAVTVRLSTDAAGWARVEIRDTGAGIPKDLLPRIFDPFFTTKSADAGTGLGLSICHSIVTDLRGRIEVDSDVGRGSTFVVSLPPARQISQRASVEPPVRARSARRGRVLVVDDEPLVVRVVEGLLGREHDTSVETRAARALERIRGGERFDAIVCDLMMPEMSGMDLHDALLEIAPEQCGRMLFVTGGAFTGRAREFLDKLGPGGGQGAPRLLEKPFDAAALMTRVRDVVDG